MRARSEQIGKVFPCPHCGASLEVARPDNEPPTSSRVPQTTTEPIRRQKLDEDNGPPEGSSESLAPSGPESQSAPPSALIRQVPMIVSAIALALSAGAFAWSVLHSPLGAGISKYDFTTPEKALRSTIDMRGSGDIRAHIEMEQLQLGKKNEEKGKTLKVHSESNYQGKKIVFVSFKENGITRNDIATFEKEADSGLWFQTFISTYKMSDPAVEKAINDWKAKTPNSESD